MGRVRQKYVIVNLPNTGQLDRDLKSLADVWVMVQKKGKALTHFLGYQPYREHPLYNKKDPIYWNEIQNPQLKEVYDELANEKDRYLDGESEESVFIDKQEHRSKINQIEEEATKAERNRIIRSLAEEDNMTHKDIADKVGLSRPTVTKIINSSA